jgi:hypothetical protein
MVLEVDDDHDVEVAPSGPRPVDFQQGAKKRTTLGMLLAQQQGLEIE